MKLYGNPSGGALNSNSDSKESGKKIEKNQIKQSVTRMAGLMSLGTMTSRVLGFVRDRLIVQFFEGATSDMFYAAFRLPNFFRVLLGEGALSVSFLPAYVDLKHKKEGEAVLAGTVWAFLALLSLSISVLGIIFMPEILEVFLSKENFPSGSERLFNTVFLARIMFFYLFLVSQFAFFMSLLNAHDEFWIPGVAPAAFNVGMILSILFLDDFMGVPASVLALGVIIGGSLQFLMVFQKAFRLRIIPQPRFLFRHPKFKQVLRRAAPSLVGIGAIQFIGVINVSLASSLGKSDITFLYLADRLLELPQSILSVSLGAALLPRLSTFWADNDSKSFMSQIYETASTYYFLAIPAAIGLFTLAQPLATLLFKTGTNTFEDMALVGSLVQVYAVLLLISGTSRLLLPGFYAAKNTIIPASTSCLTILIHLVLAPTLVKDLGLQGLVLSTTISSLTALLVIFVLFGFFVNKINPLKLFKSLPVLVLLNLPVAGLCYWALNLWQQEEALLLKNLILVGSVLLVVVVYFLMGFLFKVPYARAFVGSLRRKL